MKLIQTTYRPPFSPAPNLKHRRSGRRRRWGPTLLWLALALAVGLILALVAFLSLAA